MAPFEIESRKTILKVQSGSFVMSFRLSSLQVRLLRSLTGSVRKVENKSNEPFYIFHLNFKPYELLISSISLSPNFFLFRLFLFHLHFLLLYL